MGWVWSAHLTLWGKQLNSGAIYVLRRARAKLKKFKLPHL